MATTKLKSRKIFSRFNRQRIQTKQSAGKGGAKQSFKDECDINQIMAKYQKTGAITHFAKHSPSYGFASSMDFNAAMQLISQAQTMFDELPSKLRARFDNSPDKFLDFVQDPANGDEMRTLGLSPSKAESPDTDAPAAAEGDPQPPAGSSETPPTG